MSPTSGGALLLTLASPAWGQDFETGVQAFEQRDYATTQRELRPLAEQGLASAEHILGVMHDHGWGVLQDDTEAVKWYRKAAEQGIAGAQLNLGVSYANGEGWDNPAPSRFRPLCRCRCWRRALKSAFPIRRRIRTWSRSAPGPITVPVWNCSRRGRFPVRRSRAAGPTSRPSTPGVPPPGR